MTGAVVAQGVPRLTRGVPRKGSDAASRDAGPRRGPAAPPAEVRADTAEVRTGYARGPLLGQRGPGEGDGDGGVNPRRRGPRRFPGRKTRKTPGRGVCQGSSAGKGGVFREDLLATLAYY